ncbi:MAG: aminoglycoside phosphotransferase family protein [Clostridia bacterium]|nr:aminoglycoside phosphotransferase family protein [Clostridia bacterium]
MESLKTITDVCRAFGITGEPTDYQVFTSGHINSTFRIAFEENGQTQKYLVQNVNTLVFKDPDALMENIVRVTHYLRKRIREQGGDPERETLHFLKTTDGKLCLHRGERCWRVYRFIDHSFTYELLTDAAPFRSAGERFGHFQRLLADYPIESLYETIPDFHHTPKRVAALEAAAAADVVGRAHSVQNELSFALERKGDAEVALRLLKEGKVPLRVTHNDTKLSNILFDETTKQGICVIDLDTIMPGLSLYDFGDAIRFGAATAKEDERDLSLVSVSPELFRAYTAGFLSACVNALTEAEIDHLAFSAKLMTYECGVRFLTDYLCGDTYFKIAAPDHNLVRARNQFKLVAEMERMMPELEQIVKEEAAKALRGQGTGDR